MQIFPEEIRVEKLLYEHDICLLNETWRNDESKIGLPGLWDFSLIRPKTTKKGRPSGGITVFCKEDIRKGVKVSSHKEGFVWLRLDNNFFNLDNPLFIGAAYIPPQYTAKHINIKTDYYQELTDSLVRYSREGNVLIAGDLNARTGNSEVDPIINIPWVDELDHSVVNKEIETRLSCDIVVNNYGKKLTSLCSEHNLVIANGRIPGDRIGNFTCHTNRGDSVVDYIISDHDFFDRLKQLVIHAPTFGSVHSPMSVTINCSSENPTQVKKPPLPPPPKFIWDPSKKEQFLGLLTVQFDNMSKIRESLESSSCTKEETGVLLKGFTDIVYNCAQQCFKMPKKTRRVKRATSKPWYNNDCQNLKKRLANQARLLKKHPNNSHIRGAFMSCKKDYRKCVK